MNGTTYPSPGAHTLPSGTRRLLVAGCAVGTPPLPLTYQLLLANISPETATWA